MAAKRTRRPSGAKTAQPEDGSNGVLLSVARSLFEKFLNPENIGTEMHTQASRQLLINDVFVNENAMQARSS
jgi:hypothetical protein